jgi:hypothetical protein
MAGENCSAGSILGRELIVEKAKARRNPRTRTTSLGREQAVYDANLPQWLREHDGAHVLIKGREVVGFYRSFDEALDAGYARFGVVSLFVKKVAASEPIYNIPNALI